MNILEKCDTTYPPNLLEHIKKKIKENTLIILTRDINPMNNAFARDDNDICSNYICNVSGSLPTKLDKPNESDLPKSLPKLHIESIESNTFIPEESKEFDNFITLNSTEKYSIGINQKTTNNIIPLEQTIDEHTIKFIKLNKNYRCYMQSISAFNYHITINDIKNLSYLNDIKKKYSTGLWEYIINYTKKNNIKDINITVCGEYDKTFYIYTIIFGLKYYKQLYYDSSNNVTFTYNVSYKVYTDEEKELLYKYITIYIKHIYTSKERNKNSSDGNPFNISFTIKYDDTSVDYNYVDEALSDTEDEKNDREDEYENDISDDDEEDILIKHDLDEKRRQTKKNNQELREINRRHRLKLNNKKKGISVNTSSYKYNKYKSKYLNLF